MPAGFSWDTMDVRDPAQLDEVYTLLYENYVEDDDEMFRYAIDAAVYYIRQYVIFFLFSYYIVQI